MTGTNVSSFEIEWLENVPRDMAGKFGVAWASFLTFFIIWVLITHRPTSERIKKLIKEGTSTGVEKSELSTRFVSTIHAIVISWASMVYLYERYELGDVEFSRELQPVMHRRFEFYVAISIGFFMGDVIMCCVLFESYGPAFLFHGIVALFGFTWALWTPHENELTLMMSAFALLWEVSTPFLNNIFFLRTYLPNWIGLQALNGFCFVAVFFIARILIGYPQSVVIFNELSKLHDKGHISDVEYYTLGASVAGMAVVNMVWFLKAFRRLVSKVMAVFAKPKNE